MAIPLPHKSNQAERIELHPASSLRLDYPGKRPATDILATPPGIYLPDPSFPEGENRLYHSDNLPALAALAREPSVAGKIRLVYIDPPFATDGSFESRNQDHAFDDLLVGPAFVEALRQRLILLHSLLSDDGSLYLHLDARMVFHMRVILDEIFGEKHFRNCITRKKCNPKNYTRKTYGNISDYILFYTKTSSYVWNRPLEPWDDSRAKKEYPYTDSEGRRYKKVPLHAPGLRHGDTGKPWRGKLPPPGKHWQYTPSTLDDMDARGEISWSSTGNPRRKIYLEDSPGIPLQDIWLDVRDAHNQNTHVTGYPTEKNLTLIERIIEASSLPGDLVLDCYAGSGTTLAAASNLQRRWIGVDRSDEAIRTILQRFQAYKQECQGSLFSPHNPSSLPLFPSPSFTFFRENPSPSSLSTPQILASEDSAPQAECLQNLRLADTRLSAATPNVAKTSALDT